MGLAEPVVIIKRKALFVDLQKFGGDLHEHSRKNLDHRILHDYTCIRKNLTYYGSDPIPKTRVILILIK